MVLRGMRFRLLAGALAAVGTVLLSAPVSASAATPASASGAAPAAGAVAGANDFSCLPSPAHPFPVVLVHGTFGNASNFSALSPELARAGYCVFALTYGCQNAQQVVCGTAPIEDSAAQLSAFVDRVLRATGAGKVDIVGHSQGGMMPRYYMRFLNGAARVDRLVGLAPSNHGTTVDGLRNLAAALAGAVDCDACLEQLAGSAFLAKLNAGGDTLPGVRYTVIETRFDEVVTPFTSAFLSGPAVTNVLLQDHCPLDVTGHVSIVLDPNAIGWVQTALNPGVRPPTCTPFLLTV